MKKQKLLCALLALGLASCGGGLTASSNEGESSSKAESSSQTLLEFTGVTFSNASVDYDGNPHKLGNVEGAPNDATITYDKRGSYTDVGSYKETATISKTGYKTLTLEATLTIKPIEFQGLSVSDESIKYDGKDYFNKIQIIGNQPAGTSVKKVVKNSAGTEVTQAISVGYYYFTFTITNKNYVTMTLEATLTIKAETKNMPVFCASDGTIYFANGLHNSYLYSLNSAGEIKRLDFSAPKEFNKSSPSKAVFIAGSVLHNSVKEVSSGKTETLYSAANIDDFVKYSESVYFISSNTLKAEDSGLYKVEASRDSEPVITKVLTGKTDNLAIYGNYVYFTNKNDNNYLYKISVSGGTATKVLSEKVHEYVISNNKLYCTVNGLVNDYIGYLDLSSTKTEPTKLTNNAGEFLNVKNGHLYYHYTDLFAKIDESKKGVYDIDLSSGKETQILKMDGINGLDTAPNGDLVYVDSIDLHLYRFNPSTKQKTDLLNGFVAPETVPLNLGGKSISYGNRIYYLNMYADKTLYAYDLDTKTNIQLTADKVVDFNIINGVLYFNKVSMFSNNDFFAIDLKVSSDSVKLSENDIRNVVTDGTYIYATHYNFLGTAGGISRMKLDGSEYVKFSEINGAKNLRIKDEKLYYINASGDKGDIEYISLSDITSTSENLKGTKLHKDLDKVKQFEFEGDNIYYLFDGTIKNAVMRTTFSALGTQIELASKSTNPGEFIIVGDTIYYTNYAATASSEAGIYSVSKNATKDETYTKILACDSKYYASALAMSKNGTLFFLNYHLTFGDAHLYELNIQKGEVTKIA